MKLFFSVGEPSGDLHGANLIHELTQRTDIEAVGYGGPRMAAAGCRLHADLTQLAVMWFTRVLLNINKFWNLIARADRYFCHHRPDAVVLIDYPGFNWWIARRAKAHGIPVIYYGTPQIWAWAGWRVRKMRRFVDHVLCKLPFEEAWYRRRRCQATFVGHPYFDEVQNRQLDKEFLAEQNQKKGPLVTILPGSRTQEVNRNLPCFLRAAAIIQQHVPGVRFGIASFNARQADLARQQVAASPVQADVFVGRTPELIYLGTCCLACSGSVSLELLYHTKPTVIHYGVSWPLYYFGKTFAKWMQIRVKYITLVNMLADEPFTDRVRHFDPTAKGADRVPFPEFVGYWDDSARVADYVVRWLTDPDELERRTHQLQELKAEIAHGGASVKAAEYILSHFGSTPPPIPRPHFLPQRRGAALADGMAATARSR